MSRIVYFDCASGASGDMLLGAVVDLGLPIERLREELAKLPLAGLPDRGAGRRRAAASPPRRWTWSRRRPRQPHRHLRHILALLEASALEAEVKERAAGALPPPGGGRGRGPRHVASRRSTSTRSGAVDSIVDIVGGVIALALARRRALRGLAAQRRHGDGDDVARDVPGPAPGHGAARGRRAGLRRRARASCSRPTGALLVTGPRHASTGRCRRCGSRRRRPRRRRAARRRAARTCCA